MKDQDASRWRTYLSRYQSGEGRARIFRDLILDDAKTVASEAGKLVFLDIGCGRGFDSDPELQRSLARFAGRYVGVEPDEVALEEIFHQTHRCLFEEARIEPESVDIAFAVMVLEHFPDPHLFWDKVHTILKPGGIFWGFTVDARHWFVSASVLADKLGVKDLYLDMLHGKRGEQRYENYSVFYRSNTPEQVAGQTGSFASRTFLNFYRVGQMDYYFPKGLRWIGRSLDRLALRRQWPGSTLVVRVVK